MFCLSHKIHPPPEKSPTKCDKIWESLRDASSIASNCTHKHSFERLNVNNYSIITLTLTYRVVNSTTCALPVCSDWWFLQSSAKDLWLNFSALPFKNGGMSSPALHAHEPHLPSLGKEEKMQLFFNQLSRHLLQLRCFFQTAFTYTGSLP